VNFSLFEVTLTIGETELREKICSQFHQCYTRKFFVQTLFWQLFSSYMYVVKAAKAMFVRNFREYNVDEIDT
jgi:hypothetical protein